MAKPKQLPYLISLLDDDSPAVKQRVMSELVAFGPPLKNKLKKFSFSLNADQKDSLDQVFKQVQQLTLQSRWPSWVDTKNKYKRMERALSDLAQFLNEPYCDIKLSYLLDELAKGFVAKYPDSKDPRLLARFLFKDVALKGNEEQYYHPQNSNLVSVIMNKKGIPLSLVSVYMLVGYRLKMKIYGCPFPGHFLASIYLGGERMFVDCFSSGLVFRRQDLQNIHEKTHIDIDHILSENATPEMIIRRFLANLIRAYQFEEDQNQVAFMMELFQNLDHRLADRKIGQLTPEEIIAGIQTKFQPGQLVVHNRYGYRGIIVDFDFSCQATDQWYYNNQTQPLRAQPWYHVLVDGSDQATYVAENNLCLDESQQKIQHPLLSYFFRESKDGRYIRNDNPWPQQ